MARVLIRKSDGHPVEYQSGNAPLGMLMKNAVNAGLNPDEYEEKYITDADYTALAEMRINKPARDIQDAKKQAARGRIKTKLGLSDSELQDFKDAF